MAGWDGWDGLDGFDGFDLKPRLGPGDVWLPACGASRIIHYMGGFLPIPGRCYFWHPWAPVGSHAPNVASGH